MIRLAIQSAAADRAPGEGIRLSELLGVCTLERLVPHIDIEDATMDRSDGAGSRKEKGDGAARRKKGETKPTGQGKDSMTL